jgi:hypothetical protein
VFLCAFAIFLNTLLVIANCAPRSRGAPPAASLAPSV